MNHGWEYKPLGEICTLCSSKRVHQNEWKEAGVPFLRAREIVKLNQQGFVENELFISEEHFQKLKEYGLPQPGDIMLSAVGTLGATYVVKTSDKFYYKDASVICIKGIKGLIPQFLSRLFETKRLRSQIENKAPGATVGTITITNAKNFNIPVPPMEEQRAIVAELDAISEAIEVKHKQMAAFDALAQSIFYDTFGDPIANPKGWEVCQLKQACVDIADGDHMPPPKAETGIPFITISDVDKNRNRIDFDNTFFVNEDYFISIKDNRKPKVGDVLYTVTGSYGIPIEIVDDTKFCFQRHIALIRPKDLLNPKFLKYWILSDAIQNLSDKVAVGIAQKTVSLTSLRKFPIILPPLELQNRFAAQIEEIEREKANVEATIAQLQTLLDSRMDYWFND
ncbi:restriction endonuclease subunit S [Muribaculum intestinale]|uniref:restriction endonuclease subunit S n=1 Tax=Muribaculum intestinale TaxID=1796646 RepID=UPI00261BA30A|nr:restriction endonuclease subunit S [Muribaculum intestinale]